MMNNDEEEEVPMTRYIIQDNHFSLDDKFVVTDESGNVQYTVDSTFLAIGDKLVLNDADGKALMKIREETLHFRPTYNIYSARRDLHEMQLASIQRTGTPWNRKLEIFTPNGEYIIERKGGIFSHEFVLTKDGVIVAMVSKDSSPKTTVYRLDVAGNREEYRAFLVALVIVLSCVQRLPSSPGTPTSPPDFTQISV